MNHPFSFQILSSDVTARRGRVTTAHGTFETPCFMATGTAATVKAMTVEGVRTAGAELVICNTYHLMLRPGSERIAALGGLHKFMGWKGPILTDLADIRSCHCPACATYRKKA